MRTNSLSARLSENSEAPFADANRHAAGSQDPRWYALQTSPRHEKRVHERLAWHGLDSFLPLYETVNRWKNGCNMRVEHPLFPNYLFVQIELRNRVNVLSVPGVVSLVGAGFKPWPLPIGEIERLRDGLHLREAKPHSYLVEGQRVTIKSGPLTGVSGVLLRRNGEIRVILSVQMLMRSISVEVSADEIQAADDRSHRERVCST
jgi:transcription termination/antitermination protein NusG